MHSLLWREKEGGMEEGRKKTVRRKGRKKTLILENTRRPTCWKKKSEISKRGNAYIALFFGLSLRTPSQEQASICLLINVFDWFIQLEILIFSLLDGCVHSDQKQTGLGFHFLPWEDFSAALASWSFKFNIIRTETCQAGRILRNFLT